MAARTGHDPTAPSTAPEVFQNVPTPLLRNGPAPPGPTALERYRPARDTACTLRACAVLTDGGSTAHCRDRA